MALYNPLQVAQVNLTISDASQQALAADPSTYVPATLQMVVDGQSYGPLDVELKLKGSASLLPLGQKAAFRIELPTGDELFGRPSLTLNNMVQDPSMLHETLGYELFRAAGVPAPLTGYAYVTVNGQGYGLYLDIEPYDSVSLEQMFGTATQHLYSPDGYNIDLTSGASAFDTVIGGSNTSDLQSLISAVNSFTPGSASYLDQIAPLADLSEMTMDWAVEQYVGQWDGYSLNDAYPDPNNYYLRSDDNGVFSMLPWGLDQSFVTAQTPPFPGNGGILIQDCLADTVPSTADTTCDAQFNADLITASDIADNLVFGDQLNQIAAILAPWRNCQNLDEDGDDDAAWQAAVVEIRQYLTARRQQLVSYLGADDLGLPTLLSADASSLDSTTPPALSTAPCPVPGFNIETSTNDSSATGDGSSTGAGATASSTTTTGVVTRSPAGLGIKASLQGRRLSATITFVKLATGRIALRYKTAHHVVNLSRPIVNGRVSISRLLTPAQARQGTGTLRVVYAGSQAVLGEQATVNIAANPPQLVLKHAIIANGTLTVTGTVARGATGSIAIRFEYSALMGSESLLLHATIKGGRWTLSKRLPAAAGNGGELTIQYAGARQLHLAGREMSTHIVPVS